MKPGAVLQSRLAAAAAALACALALAAAPGAIASTVYEYEGGGRLVARDDPTVPSLAASDPAGPFGSAGLAPGGASRYRTRPTPAPLHAAASAVKRAISKAQSRNEISAGDASRYRGIYSDARNARKRMGGGTYRTELSSVISTLERIASAGRLSGSRMPALFLQLQRNREFWTGGPRLPSAGDRVAFKGSELLFQYYPGQGLQIQPLGNFGKANGLYTACTAHRSGCDEAALRKLLDELVAIRSERGGFTTWEYWFQFAGGVPPWTSGMADATAIQALARGSRYLHVDPYMAIARSALGVFDRLAPVGVRVRGMGSDSAHYLLYSFSTHQRVLNGFAQALNGLYDFYFLSGSKHALRLFDEGDRSMRLELPRYDTGAWTLYSLGGAEASLEYHELATEFLGHICKRSGIDLYCRYAERFGRYLHTPTRVSYTGPRSAHRGASTTLRFWISKVSSVTAKVADASGQRVYRSKASFARGRHSLSWVPHSSGTHRVSLSVLDLRGNHSDLAVTVSVK